MGGDRDSGRLATVQIIQHGLAAIGRCNGEISDRILMSCNSWGLLGSRTIPFRPLWGAAYFLFDGMSLTVSAASRSSSCRCCAGTRMSNLLSFVMVGPTIHEPRLSHNAPLFCSKHVVNCRTGIFQIRTALDWKVKWICRGSAHKRPSRSNFGRRRISSPRRHLAPVFWPSVADQARS